MLVLVSEEFVGVCVSDGFKSSVRSRVERRGEGDLDGLGGWVGVGWSSQEIHPEVVLGLGLRLGRSWAEAERCGLRNLVGLLRCCREERFKANHIPTRKARIVRGCFDWLGLGRSGASKVEEVSSEVRVRLGDGLGLRSSDL